MEKVPDEVQAGENVRQPQEKVAGKSNDSASTLSGTPKDKDGSKTALSLDDDAIFAHLPDHEKEILKRQLHDPAAKVSFLGLYRYASAMDIAILVVSALCSIVAGAALPLFTVGFLFFFFALVGWPACLKLGLSAAGTSVPRVLFCG